MDDAELFDILGAPDHHAMNENIRRLLHRLSIQVYELVFGSAAIDLDAHPNYPRVQGYIVVSSYHRFAC